MGDQTQREAPRACDLIRALKAHFDNQWIAADDHKPWELRLLFQLIEFDSIPFRINIAMVANRNANPQDGQHVAYLELNSGNDKLSLCWSSGVNHAVQQALTAFKTIYPLEQLITDILVVLRGYQVEVMIPEIEVQKSKANSA